MFEGILFELILIISRRTGIVQDTVTVLECPTKQTIKEVQDRYSVPGFRVYVKCKQLRGVPM